MIDAVNAVKIDTSPRFSMLTIATRLLDYCSCSNEILSVALPARDPGLYQHSSASYRSETTGKRRNLNCDFSCGRLRFLSVDRSLKADFHSVQNVARSTFSERFLLNYKQASGTNLISCG